jgi:hypothetical protein
MTGSGEVPPKSMEDEQIRGERETTSTSYLRPMAAVLLLGEGDGKL